MYTSNYVTYLFVNGKYMGECIDMNHAFRDTKSMLEFFVDDYHLPITIVDDSNKY